MTGFAPDAAQADPTTIEMTDDFVAVRRPKPVTISGLDGGRTYYGAGIAGFTAAALLAFSKAEDVRFVRPKAKHHGLMLQIEGPAARSDARPLVVTMDDRPSLPPPLAHAEFVRRVPTLVQFAHGLATVRGELPLIERHLVGRKGDFLLSSGSRRDLYIDAIPALTTYDSVVQVAECLRPLADVDIVLAPPYGGISLAVAVGLYYGIDIVIPRIDAAPPHHASLIEIARRGNRVLIVDDFTSTGGTLERIFAPLLGTGRTAVFSLCVGPKAKLNALPLRWLFRFNGRRLERPTDGILGTIPPAIPAS